PLSLHDALPISKRVLVVVCPSREGGQHLQESARAGLGGESAGGGAGTAAQFSELGFVDAAVIVQRGRLHDEAAVPGDDAVDCAYRVERDLMEHPVIRHVCDSSKAFAKSVASGLVVWPASSNASIISANSTGLSR